MAAGDPQLAQLRQSVADLAQAQRALHLRVEALTTLVEERATEGASSAPSASLSELPPVPPGPRRSFLRRAARFVLRKTLGTARKLWDAAHPDPPWADEIILVRGKKPAEIPRLLSPDQASDARAEDLLWTAPPPADLPTNFSEIACLLVAIENLDLLRYDLPGGSRWIVRRALWSEAGLDLAALERVARAAQRPLGKVLGGAPDLDGPLPALPDGRPLLRRSGAHLIAALEMPRQWHLPLAPLATPSSDRPARLIIAEESLTRGFDRALARTLRERTLRERTLGEEPQTVLAVLAGDALSRRRAASLARMHDRVWFLGDFEEPCHDDVLAYLGGGAEVLRLGPTGTSPAEWGAAHAQEPEAIDPADRESLRRELGADDSTLVVLWSDDLIPASRPEDFVLLAHTLRDHRELLFVLDGEGPLLGSVRDLRAYFGVERLVIVSKSVDAAADIFCRTAPSPFPDRLRAARAAGMRVLTAEEEPLADALREMTR